MQFELVPATAQATSLAAWKQVLLLSTLSVSVAILSVLTLALLVHQFGAPCRVGTSTRSLLACQPPQSDTALAAEVADQTAKAKNS